MTARFEPPVVLDVPTVTPDSRRSNPHGWRLFRWYSPRPRGRTVLKLLDGTYVTVDMPTGTQIETAAAVYLGGHIYTVDTVEQAALEEAGFGDQLTPIADEPVTPARRFYPATDRYPSTSDYPGVP